MFVWEWTFSLRSALFSFYAVHFMLPSCVVLTSWPCIPCILVPLLLGYVSAHSPTGLSTATQFQKQQKRQLTAGNQPARSHLVSGPAGTHDRNSSCYSLYSLGTDHTENITSSNSSVVWMVIHYCGNVRLPCCCLIMDVFYGFTIPAFIHYITLFY
jgi:hypothetical protein